MSTATPTAATPADQTPAAAAADPRGGPSRAPDPVGRAVRRWVLWVAGVLTVMLALTYIAGLAGSSEVALDPNNPNANGMQGIAQVLGQEGIEVEVVRGLDALPADSAQGATVMVSPTDYLSRAAGRELLDYSRDASSLVVLSPADTLSEVFDIDAEVTARLTTTPMSPECDSSRWAAEEQVTHGDALVTVQGGEATVGGDDAQVTTCLPPSPGFNAGGSNAGYLVEIETSEQRPIVLAGLATALTNEHILNEANAATGLRLLGGSDRLIWVIPTIADAGDLPARGLFDVLPDPVAPAMALAVVALGMVALVRGRRLGPVSTEPLPVVIRAIETTTSRGRLYAQAHDRGRALASLQLASRRRLAHRLGLAARAEPDEIVTAVATATGRHTDEVRRLLVNPYVEDDETLVRIARDLRALEEGTTST